MRAAPPKPLGRRPPPGPSAGGPNRNGPLPPPWGPGPTAEGPGARGIISVGGGHIKVLNEGNIIFNKNPKYVGLNPKYLILNKPPQD